MNESAEPDRESFQKALERQKEEDANDRSLIVERLSWTADERLEANADFLRFYLGVRPEGPLIRE